MTIPTVATELNRLALAVLDGSARVGDQTRFATLAHRAAKALQEPAPQLPLMPETLGAVVRYHVGGDNVDECEAAGTAVARAVVGALLRTECVEAALDRYDDSPTSESLQDGMRAAIQAAIAKAATLPAPADDSQVLRGTLAMVRHKLGIDAHANEDEIGMAIESLKDDVADGYEKVSAEAKSLRADADRWRQAAASGAENDETLAQSVWDARGTMGSWWAANQPTQGVWIGDARVMREHVQARCAAQVAEALDMPVCAWSELLKHVEDAARASDAAEGINGEPTEAESIAEECDRQRAAEQSAIIAALGLDASDYGAGNVPEETDVFVARVKTLVTDLRDTLARTATELNEIKPALKEMRPLLGCDDGESIVDAAKRVPALRADAEKWRAASAADALEESATQVGLDALGHAAGLVGSALARSMVAAVIDHVRARYATELADLAEYRFACAESTVVPTPENLAAVRGSGPQAGDTVEWTGGITGREHLVLETVQMVSLGEQTEKAPLVFAFVPASQVRVVKRADGGRAQEAPPFVAKFLEAYAQPKKAVDVTQGNQDAAYAGSVRGIAEVVAWLVEQRT